MNPAWQLINQLIRRQGVWGEKGRAACRAACFQMSWLSLDHAGGRPPRPGWVGVPLLRLPGII